MLLSANEGYCSSLQTTFARAHGDLFDKLAAVIFSDVEARHMRMRLQSVDSCRETQWKTLEISLCRCLRQRGMSVPELAKGRTIICDVVHLEEH